MRREAGEGDPEAHSPRRAAEDRAPVRDPRCRSQGAALVLRGIQPGRRKPLRRLFSGFLDTSEGGVGGPARRTMSSRGAEQVDITRYFSDSTSALLQRAARRASEWESPNLDAEHLLHAALEDGVVRRVVEEVDADPDQIRAQLEEEAERGGRRPLPRSRPRPSARYWRPTRSRARSGPHTSVRNTCCSR